MIDKQRVGLLLSGFLLLASSPTFADSTYWATLEEFDRPLPSAGYFYNKTGGNRGTINDGPVTYSWNGNSAYTATVVSNPPGGWQFGGMFYSLIRDQSDHIPLNFQAAFGPYVQSQFQARVTGIEIVIAGVTTPSNNPILDMKIEFKNTAGQVVHAFGIANLNTKTYPHTTVVDLTAHNLGNIETINWVLDHAFLGDAITMDRIRLRVVTPTLGLTTEPFLWSYAWLMANYSPTTGLIQDRSNFRSGSMENISATGKAAKIVAYAWKKGITSQADAVTIITKMADTLLTKVPRGPTGVNTLWPHFTQNAGASIIPNTEWASGDTAYAALDLMAALQMIGDPNNQLPAVQSFITGINWQALRNLTADQTISHGYQSNGTPLTAGWDAFGMETIGVNWAYASATGQRTAMLAPPSYNGSGFIDEAHYPMVLSGIDAWGNNWNTYRNNRATAQVNWYTPAKNSFLNNARLFGLSAAEIPEADNPSIPNDQKYRAYGIGGLAPADDGNAQVIALHYNGMVADLKLNDATLMWSNLRQTGDISPLNNIESMRVHNVTGQKTVNNLKGSWNLTLQAEGWAYTDSVIKTSLDTAVFQNAFLKKGLDVLIPLPASSANEGTKELFTDAGFANPNQNLFVYNAASPITANIVDATAVEGRFSMRFRQPAGQWSGGGIYNVTAPNGFTTSPQNYSDYFNGHIRFWLKSTITTQLTVEHAGGQPPKIIIPATGGAWVEKVYPISQFGLTLSQLQQIVSPFILVADAAGAEVDYYVDHVRWTKPLASLVAFPTSHSAPAGAHREVIVEGRGASGQFVDVYPTWSVSGGGHTLNTGSTAASRYAIVTVGTANGSIAMQSTADGISGTVPITLGTQNATPYGIGFMSETVLGAISGVDVLLGTSNSGGGSNTITTNSTEFMEGTVSQNINVVVPSPGSSAGWYMQWGLSGSPDTFTRDMGAYYDGSIRFWFKGPPALSTMLRASIRSGNVPAGTEASIVQLSDYVPFDNTWHQVIIPLSAFAKAAPYADLSRVKILFGIQAVFAGVSTPPGGLSYRIDNLRWDPTAPGPLSSITVTPTPITIPFGTSRSFLAKGFDSTGLQVDIQPTWSATAGLGTLTPQGTSALLAAGFSPASGSVTASVGTINGSALVTVGDVTYTQTYNVYGDQGTGGSIGVAFGTAAGNNMVLTDTIAGPRPPTSQHSMISNWTLVNSPGVNDAFSVWFVSEPNGSRFMQPYANGYLQFYVRSTKDLQVSIRSANITPGTERCKFRLSQMGIPLDGNWQKVTMSMADFLAAEPLLDFSQIATYFTIGVLSEQIGTGTGSFAVADVKWLTASTTVIEPTKILAGMVAKQNSTTGLITSYGTDTNRQAVTYDQALAAMAFTYQGGTYIPLAKKIFEAYKTLDPTGANGYRDGYHRDTMVPLAAMNGRTVGPNAWLLLALIHYRNVTGDTAYDTMMSGIAGWIISLQEADGSIRFGFHSNGTAMNNKSTEQNFDVYAAFKAYSRMTGNNTYLTSANSVHNWILTKAWNASEGRFNIGRGSIAAGDLPDTDKALDVYSWAPLALGGYASLLDLARQEFRNIQPSSLTGFSIDGFDFGGILGNSASYRDAVWLEGTGQMVCAYWSLNDTTNATYFLNQIEKSILNTSPDTQGIAYATNGGTGYGGFAMDSQNPSLSSMAWYLFAKNRFNPFAPIAAANPLIRNVSDNNATAEVAWTVPPASAWVRSSQYIALDLDFNTPGWGVQIYTDNKAQGANPMFNGNPAQTDPSGLVDTLTGTTRLPMAWSIKASTATPPVAANPNTVGNPFSSQWNFIKDKSTVDIPSANTLHFENGELPIRVIDDAHGIHTTQTTFDQGFFPTAYLYLAVDFSQALTQLVYKTSTITIEFFQE